ncbi:MAG TPA: hypothetical protein VNR20_00090 [Terriglobales bacterium]|nr:hypothetical protein [Terriglobales bacterium]
MKRNFLCCGLLAFLLFNFDCALAQFAIQGAQTMADFRGVHALNDSVAWVSGTNGTVLRTQDGGVHWEKCAVPLDAEKLDFRAIWAWDAQRAEVMSAGPGEHHGCSPPPMAAGTGPNSLAIMTRKASGIRSRIQ